MYTKNSLLLAAAPGKLEMSVPIFTHLTPPFPSLPFPLNALTCLHKSLHMYCFHILKGRL